MPARPAVNVARRSSPLQATARPRYTLADAAPSSALALPQPDKGHPLAKPNYAFQKRQRDLAKQQKKEEKQRKKAASKAVVPEGETQPTAPESGKPEP